MTPAPMNAKIHTAKVGNCLYKPHPYKSTEKGPGLLRTDERRAVPIDDRNYHYADVLSSQHCLFPLRLGAIVSQTTLSCGQTR